MANYPILVDAERLVIEFLLTHDALGDLVGDRIYTELPPSPTMPLALIKRTPGPPPVIEQHLATPSIQGEGWAGDKQTAWEVAATLQAAMHDLRLYSHDLGVVTAVEDELDLRWFPDPPKETPRYIFEVSVFIHPHRQTAGS